MMLYSITTLSCWIGSTHNCSRNLAILKIVDYCAVSCLEPLCKHELELGLGAGILQVDGHCPVVEPLLLP
jgi:hypothetical protein